MEIQINNADRVLRDLDKIKKKKRKKEPVYTFGFNDYLTEKQ